MAGVAEVYFPAFGLALGLSPIIAGLIATMPLLAGGLLQLLAPRVMQRVSSMRSLLVGCVVLQALSFVPLVAIALAGVASPAVVFGAASLYWAAGMAATAAWNPWMARVVPPRVRSRFFGRRQGLLQGTMLASLIGAGLALHAAAGSSHVLVVYAAMFAVAALARLVSAVMLLRQGTEVDASPQEPMRFRHLPPRVRGTQRAPMLGYLVAALAAAAISGPFLTPYLIDHQGLGHGFYSVFTAMIVVAKTASLPILGRLIRRFGVRRVLTVSAFAITPLPLLWSASASGVWLLAVQAVSGVAWAGFDLGMLMIMFDGEDDGERTTMQSAFSALQAIGTAGASLVGGAMLGVLGSGESGYVWVFVISTCARLAAVALLVRELPLVIARLPLTVVVQVWTLALRPWGGTIGRPVSESIQRLRKVHIPARLNPARLRPATVRVYAGTRRGLPFPVLLAWSRARG